ncbi:MAG: aldehyde dehydrogenase family protein, partial [Planctomycetes bacterium]|nr:aldehyde dehydrogenase family protein [Planctomycetota bacterium]
MIARSPIDGARTATVAAGGTAETEAADAAAENAFPAWRSVPAPRRGEYVRRIAERLRARKADLAALITL